jgi:hypothetical protein
MANAFACRSATRWPGALGWASNRLLVGAVVVEALALAAFLLIPSLASLLDQAFPPLAGFAVAVLAAPAVLIADAVHKRVRARRRRNNFSTSTAAKATVEATATTAS